MSLLDSRQLVEELMSTDRSISRVGRNAAAGLLRKPHNDDPAAEADKQPKTARAGGAKAAAATEQQFDTSGSLSARPSKTSKERTATKALNVTASMTDHRLAFGRGVRDDDGKRREMCSSPRPHPELDMFLLSEFEADRRQQFEAIQDSVPALKLVDTEAVEEELAARVPAKMPAGAAPGATPPARTPGRGVTPEPRHAPQNAAAPSKAPAPPAAGAPTAKQPMPFLLQKPAGQGDATSPRKMPGGASPRPPVETVSSSFASPERFASPKRREIAPEVGHYRPKYKAVHHSVTSGKILPPGSCKSRLPPTDDSKEPAPAMSDVLKHAREEVRPRALKEREERRREQAADDDIDELGVLARKKKAGPPEPTRDSSPAFKSRVPGTTVASRASAAPDQMYWPIGDNGTFRTDRANIDFSKQRARPPLAENAVLPDPRSTVTAFSPDVARNAPDLSKYSPRKPVNQGRDAGPDAPLHPERADVVRYERVRVADFATAKSSPRKVSSNSPRYGDGGVVSVETVSVIPHPADRRVVNTGFDATSPRKAPKPPADLPPLDVSYDSVYHRSRAAIVRADAGGHGSVFAGDVSPRGGTVAEVGAYNPDVSKVRPKRIRDVDFTKGLERKEPQANIADLTYDVKPVSPRVMGNPMIGKQISRVKRETVLATKSGAADKTYDVSPLRGAATGMIDFGRQVDRRSHAPGREASERTQDRERNEQAAAAEAALARLASKGRHGHPRDM